MANTQMTKDVLDIINIDFEKEFAELEKQFKLLEERKQAETAKRSKEQEKLLEIEKEKQAETAKRSKEQEKLLEIEKEKQAEIAKRCKKQEKLLEIDKEKQVEIEKQEQERREGKKKRKEERKIKKLVEKESKINRKRTGKDINKLREEFEIEAKHVKIALPEEKKIINSSQEHSSTFSLDEINSSSQKEPEIIHPKNISDGQDHSIDFEFMLAEDNEMDNTNFHQITSSSQGNIDYSRPLSTPIPAAVDASIEPHPAQIEAQEKTDEHPQKSILNEVDLQSILDIDYTFPELQQSSVQQIPITRTESEPINQQLIQFPTISYDHVISEGVTRLLETIEPIILKKQKDIEDVKVSKKGYRTVQSFIANEWSSVMDNNRVRSKNILERVNKLNEDGVTNYNFLVSQLHSTNERLSIIENKLVEILYLLQPRNQPLRDDQRNSNFRRFHNRR